MKDFDFIDVILIAMLMCALGFMIGCKSDNPISVNPSPTPIFSPAPVVKYAWKNELWDAELNDAIFREKLHLTDPADAKDFNLNPKSEIGWGKILVMMSKYESNWKPETTYQEAFGDAKGNPVISSGLFQISIESSNARGCNFKSQNELFNPVKNIRCAVKIFAYWVHRDGRIAGHGPGQWRGGARYWAVLRGTTEHTKKALTAIKGANK